MVRVSYLLVGNQRSVTSNGVGEELAQRNGGATFLTAVFPAWGVTPTPR